MFTAEPYFVGTVRYGTIRAGNATYGVNQASVVYHYVIHTHTPDCGGNATDDTRRLSDVKVLSLNVILRFPCTAQGS